MFFHVQRLINEIVPDEPDPAAANALQEGLGGQFGEMRTMMQYLFQSINFRGPTGKPYRDLLQGIGTEEIGHVELIGTTIARLARRLAPLPGQPPTPGRARRGRRDAAVGRARRRQHPPLPRRRPGRAAGGRAGNPWSGSYVYNSGNLVLDLLYNLMLESTGRLQKCRHLRDDGQQDRPLDDRVPDRARPGPRERLRQGAGDPRRGLEQARCRSRRPTRRGSPRSRSCWTWDCRASSTRSTYDQSEAGKIFQGLSPSKDGTELDHRAGPRGRALEIAVERPRSSRPGWTAS